ncbi:MAG: hypothetical protein OHK0017_06140 [Patescibacteria group bacterium]
MIVRKQVRHKYIPAAQSKQNYLNVYRIKQSRGIPNLRPLLVIFFGLILVFAATASMLQVRALTEQVVVSDKEIEFTFSNPDSVNGMLVNYSSGDSEKPELGNLIKVGNDQIAALTPKPEPEKPVAPVVAAKKVTPSTVVHAEPERPVKSTTNDSLSASSTSTLPAKSAATLLPVPDNGCTVGKSFDAISSWYGIGFQDKKTANGEIYDVNKLTAAHPSLPFGTILKVTNPKNNLTVEVRINDRSASRLDLSQKAMEQLDGINDGVINSKASVLSCGK